METIKQKVLAFYDWTADRSQSQILPPPPSEDQIRHYLSVGDCPLRQIVVGSTNEGNLRTLKRFAFTALKRCTRSCRGCNFLMCAQSGQGKTYIVKQFAKTIGIPFVFVQSSALQDSWMLFEMIKDVVSQQEVKGDHLFPSPSVSRFPPITEDTTDPNAKFVIPPCIVFLDEAHQINRKLMKGGLLNAMESSDGYLQVKPPGIKTDSLMINCKHVCWVGATTERGMLFDALENRFGTTIEWAPASAEEIAKIVEMRLEEKVKTKLLPFTMPNETIAKVANYRHIPREAISFAEKVVQHKDMFDDDSWDKSIETVAKDIGLDQWGFSAKQIAILSALGQRPIAEERLANVARCRKEQVEQYELPFLMSYANGGPLVICLSGKGMCITKKGLQELEKRGITHKGEKITVEHFEARR